MYKVSKLFIFLSLLIIGVSCSTSFQRFLPQNPPCEINYPNDIQAMQIGAPPLLISNNNYVTKKMVGSQYFKIAIWPCIDTYGTSDNLKNSLADMFYTVLFDTKRFSLLDRGEIQKIREIKIRIDTSNTRKSNDSKVVDVVLADKEKAEGESNKIISDLSDVVDGFMLIYITSDDKSKGSVVIDYRIVRPTKNTKEPIVMYAGSRYIGYKYEKISSSLDFNRNDITAVASEIKEKFPNPEQENLKITNKRGDIITVNAGKKDNITAGLRGYVVKIDKDLYNNRSISYRALFEVIEVFPDNFNARLLENSDEDKYIIPTIQIGEPVKMK